jgi:hypothetical protein
MREPRQSRRCTGIQDNLADKAKRLGIPVWKFSDRGA